LAAFITSASFVSRLFTSGIVTFPPALTVASTSVVSYPETVVRLPPVVSLLPTLCVVVVYLLFRPSAVLSIPRKLIGVQLHHRKCHQP